MSYPFKISDSVHGFIRFGEIEKEVINSRPFQRLRYIHQMAVAYLVYPGATHSRFEHSLGVMELATRIYNTLVAPHNQIKPFNKTQEEIDYWRQIVRFAALCHDMGHLPFSHTAEKSLLPEIGHEGMTLKIIHSPELRKIWDKIGPNAVNDIVNLSVSHDNPSLSSWEKMLSKIITEDSFGADRIDYLIRDGRYTGVGYGHFDYHQLIDTLRILNGDLGILASGIQSVESLWIARYMMYARVYLHPKVRVFTNHLHRFMRTRYQDVFSQNLDTYLEKTDYMLLSDLAKCAKQGDSDAQVLLKQRPPYFEVPVKDLSEATKEKLESTFGDAVFIDEIVHKKITCLFPVYLEDGSIVDCDKASPFIRDIPAGGQVFSLYVDPDKKDAIEQMLQVESTPKPRG